MNLNKFLEQKTAQTALELAIFGAVVFFVIGILVRQAFNANYTQNHTFRAMRYALSQSFKTSHGYGIPLPGGEASEPSSARNVASILFIEDRLTPTAEKYGSLTRTPYVIASAGSFSQNLFLPLDYNTENGPEDFNIPRFDVFVNGQHFVFSLAGFREIGGLDQLGTLPPGYGYENDWINNCIQRTVVDLTGPHLETRGCLGFHQVIVQMPQGLNSKYCHQDDSSCTQTPPSCNICTNWPVAKRFDLDQNPGTGVEVAAVDRANFTWQWYLIKAFVPEQSKSWGSAVFNGQVVQRIIPYNNAPVAQPYGETISIGQDKRKNINVDVDKDLKEESILAVETNEYGVIRKVKFLDDQAGDFDITRDDISLGPDPGLQDNVSMYTTTRDGTYFLMQEGKLFTGTDPLDRQYVRSVQKKDRVDIIERVFQLSSDTGHLCGNGTVNPRLSNPICTPADNSGCIYWDVGNHQPNYKQNPDVEACASDATPPFTDCFISNNYMGKGPMRKLTCFDEDAKTLYIRSRIQDLGGRKWVTRMEIPP